MYYYHDIMTNFTTANYGKKKRWYGRRESSYAWCSPRLSSTTRLHPRPGREKK